jgi:choice-of-anchor A domain-containing protein
MNINKKGLVLTIVASLAVIIMLTGLGLLRLGYHARIQAVNAASVISSKQAADAGLTKAKLLMNKKLVDELVWDNDSLPVATNIALDNSYASYSYTVTGDSSGFTVTSVGRAGTATETVYASLKAKSLWTGLSVKGTIDIKNGATFSTIPADSDFAIITNSTASDSIILKSGVVVPGDVVVGPGGDVNDAISTKMDTVIEGQTYAADEEIYYPPVVVPTELEALMTISYSYSEGTPLTGDIKFSSITVPNSGVQEIQGDCRIYVTSDIILDNNSELVVKSGASLEIYVGTGIEAKTSANLNNETADADNLLIYGLDTCTQIDIKNSSDFYGAVYAPNADLTIYNGGDLYGAFVGNSFEMKNSGSFYYDTSLANIGIDDQTAHFSVIRWWED